MAGRPRKPIALAAAQGDRGKCGALRHAEAIAASFIAQRGRPPFPSSLAVRELGRDASDAAVAAEIRREAAREHWEYICSTLESEGLLCIHDGGILEGMAWNHANQMECFAAGAVKMAATLQSEYRASSNLVGLNEVARAKIEKPKAPVYSSGHLALVDDLPKASTA